MNTEPDLKAVMRLIAARTMIIGVIRSIEDLEYALANPEAADGYEWRVDAVCGGRIVDGIWELKELGKVVIITVRDPREGGLQPTWDIAKRISLFAEYMYLGTLLDLEAASAVKLLEIIRLAKHTGKGTIISHHSLKDFPAAEAITQSYGVFEAVEGDIFKLAVVVETRDEMDELRTVAARTMREFPHRVAPMAIGERFGRPSREEFAHRGAAFVYCYLADEVVAGQWQALEFRKRMKW